MSLVEDLGDVHVARYTDAIGNVDAALLVLLGEVPALCYKIQCLEVEIVV